MESVNHPNREKPKILKSRNNQNLIIMNWYFKVLKQYADFNGRARRKEYWYFVLVNFFVGIILTLINADVISYIYSIAILIPSLAVVVRRLHDIGKSGWMILIALIPLAGAIWLLVLMLTDSLPGTNEYGPNPKEEVTQE
jgi:uncharacterized membrane protein YhaH (DUF805 family)